VAFGSTNTTTSSAFGKSAFGQPTFGQASTPAASTNTTSAFGQPSAFGTPSAFGQPAASSVIKPATGAFSAFAGTTPTAFGAGASNTSNTTNSVGTGGGFSAFANANQQPSSFGAGAANGGGGSGAFGQSGFGTTPAQGTSVFGAPAPVTSAFGSTNTSTTSAFGQSAFGQTSQPSAFSAFGQNTGGGTNNAISAFGQPQQTTSAFTSSRSQSQSNAFQQTQPDLPASSTPSIAKPAPAAKGPPDFLNAPSTFRPGLTPYDSQLPPNYTTILPGLAMEAFKATKFEWGKVPEWIPPVELRGPQGATFS
jgi:nucleoporin NUP42